VTTVVLIAVVSSVRSVARALLRSVLVLGCWTVTAFLAVTAFIAVAAFLTVVAFFAVRMLARRLLRVCLHSWEYFLVPATLVLARLLRRSTLLSGFSPSAFRA
jgi:hypothetical protein